MIKTRLPRKKKKYLKKVGGFVIDKKSVKDYINQPTLTFLLRRALSLDNNVTEL